MKCVSTGRKCDGYDDRDPRTTSGPDQTTSELRHSTKLVSANIGRDERENQCFHFFRTVTAVDVAGLVDSDFWTYGLLQAAHMYPAVRHAATALGALHQRFITGNGLYLPRNISFNHIKFALTQYNKAIQCLTNSQSASTQTYENRIAVLTTCMLFICICSLQGHQSQAILHIRSGINLIREWELDKSSPSSQLSQNPISAGVLTTIFARFDFQTRTLLDQFTKETWSQTFKLSNESQEPFRSLPEAYENLVILSNQLLELIQRREFISFDQVKNLLDQRGVYAAYFKNWDDRFSGYLAALTDTSQIKDISILRIHRLLMHVALNINPFEGELGYDRFRDSFNEIVELASTVIGTEASSVSVSQQRNKTNLSSIYPTERQTASSPSFSASMGVIEPLYFIASRCRDPIVRYKALDLLSSYPRREGIWDSNLAARIAEMGIKIEENAASNQPITSSEPCSCVTRTSDFNICAQHRIRDVDLFFQGERKVKIVLRTVEQAKQSEKGKEVIIEW